MQKILFCILIICIIFHYKKMNVRKNLLIIRKKIFFKYDAHILALQRQAHSHSVVCS